MSLYESGIILLKILPVFSKMHPEIEVFPVEGSYYQLEKIALEGATDVTFTTPPFGTPEFVSEPILRSLLFL